MKEPFVQEFYTPEPYAFATIASVTNRRNDILKTTTFPISRVNDLRLRARRASPATMAGPEGWSLSEADPMKIVEVFDSLHMKKGYTLWACQYREHGNGNAEVWAIPDDGGRPSPNESVGPLWPAMHYRAAATDNCMEVIEGDGTPWSYLCASLLGRELAEFGALWHGCSWEGHAILGEDPFHACSPVHGEMEWADFDHPNDWTWRGDRPAEWLPTVSVEGGTVIVNFYTYSGEGSQAIYRHADTYRIGSYVPEVDRSPVATGGGGYVY